MPRFRQSPWLTIKPHLCDCLIVIVGYLLFLLAFHRDEVIFVADRCARSCANWAYPKPERPNVPLRHVARTPGFDDRAKKNAAWRLDQIKQQNESKKGD